MITVAVIYDLVQIFLTLIGIGFLINWIISIWATLTFGTWLALRGISPMKARRGVTWGASVVIKMIPFLNALPGWTVSAITTVTTVRLEDELARHPALAPIAKIGQAFKKAA